METLWKWPGAISNWGDQQFMGVVRGRPMGGGWHLTLITSPARSLAGMVNVVWCEIRIEAVAQARKDKRGHEVEDE